VVVTKILPFGTLIIGLGLGAWWNHQPVAPAAAPAVAAQPAVHLASWVPSPPAAPAGVDPVALRAIIREELAAALSNEVDRKPTAEPASTVVSPEIVAQRRDAQADIDALVAGSVWGNAQRANFQQRLSLLDPEQREHAMQELISGINSGALEVKTDGPPF
jgi:hypothetical protein